MLEPLLKSIEIFSTGSVCVDMLRHIEDKDDLRYFTQELDSAYENFEKDKLPKLYIYEEGGKKCIINEGEKGYEECHSPAFLKFNKGDGKVVFYKNNYQ